LKISWLSLFVAALIGLGGAFVAIVGQALMQAAVPQPVVIEELKIQKLENFWLLDIDIHAPPVGSCTRFTHHLIYRLVGERREYVPLGFAQSNFHFPGSTPYLKALLQIPRGVALGEWNYVDRSIFLCVVWPGLTRVTAMETPPIAIRLEN
jgi:hypothetical protein